MRLVTFDDGQSRRIGALEDGKIIDLSMNGGTKIIKPIYAQKYGINPATYFM